MIKHQHRVLPPRKMGDNFFALGEFYSGEPWWGKAILNRVRMSFFTLRGCDHQSLVVSVDLNENLPAVKIDYLLMAYHFKDKLRHLL